MSDSQPVFVHPSSAIFNHSVEWVVYHTLVLTSKEYMREVTQIDPKWLLEVTQRANLCEGCREPV